VIARALAAFPGEAGPPGIALTATVGLVGPAALEFRYRLAGDVALVSVPAPARSARAERLWERTCFEAFVAPAAGEPYVELNFSPSTEWAAYAFDGYRRGMRALELASAPVVAVERASRALVVTASVDLASLAGAGWPWRVGLTAVVASAAGQTSHWALLHPAEKPDFHAAAGWPITLEGTVR
jgi:hypothetical protein